MEAMRWATRLLDAGGLPDDLEAVLHFVLWWAGPVSAQWPTLRHSERVVELTSGRGGPLEPLGYSAVARDHIIPASVSGDEELMHHSEELAAKAVVLSTGGHPAIELYSRMWFGMTLASFLKPERDLDEFAAAVELPMNPPYNGIHYSVRANLAIACGSSISAASRSKPAVLRVRKNSSIPHRCR